MTGPHDDRDDVLQIRYQASHPAYGVNFPEIPEIITSGRPLAEAFSHACEALDLHLESDQKLGLAPPRSKRRLVIGEREAV